MACDDKNLRARRNQDFLIRANSSPSLLAGKNSEAKNVIESNRSARRMIRLDLARDRNKSAVLSLLVKDARR